MQFIILTPFIGAAHVPVTELTDKNINHNTSQNITKLDSPQSKCAKIVYITAHNSVNSDNPSNILQQVNKRNDKFWPKLGFN